MRSCEGGRVLGAGDGLSECEMCRDGSRLTSNASWMAFSPSFSRRAFSLISCSLLSFLTTLPSTNSLTALPKSFSSSPSDTSRILILCNASSASGSFSSPFRARADRRRAFNVVLLDAADGASGNESAGAEMTSAVSLSVAP
jgi:hypothetical protein